VRKNRLQHYTMPQIMSHTKMAYDTFKAMQ